MVTKLTIVLFAFLASPSWADTVEVYCNIVNSQNALECQWVGREKRLMTSDDIANFIELSQVEAYITVRSRKGHERTFFVDGKSKPFRQLADHKRQAPISEINKFKSELFSDIEKRAIKISDDLDSQLPSTELLQYDPHFTYNKNRKENRAAYAELEALKQNKDKLCTSTPLYEQLSKANLGLQKTLSNVISAIGTPGTCLDDFKVFKDREGAVDLRQLDQLPEKYKLQCRKK